MLGQKHLYCGFRPTTPESTPVPRTNQGLCHFHVFGKFVKYIDPPLDEFYIGGKPAVLHSGSGTPRVRFSTPPRDFK